MYLIYRRDTGHAYALRFLTWECAWAVLGQALWPLYGVRRTRQGE